MEISKEEYFFYEWLIVEKEISKEKFKKLSHKEFEVLLQEYISWEEKRR
jgi:hypothetical protein